MVHLTRVIVLGFDLRLPSPMMRTRSVQWKGIGRDVIHLAWKFRDRCVAFLRFLPSKNCNSIPDCIPQIRQAGGNWVELPEVVLFVVVKIMTPTVQSR